MRHLSRGGGGEPVPDWLAGYASDDQTARGGGAFGQGKAEPLVAAPLIHEIKPRWGESVCSGRGANGGRAISAADPVCRFALDNRTA